MIVLIVAALTLAMLVSKHYGFLRLQEVDTTTILLIGAFLLVAGWLW